MIKKAVKLILKVLSINQIDLYEEGYKYGHFTCRNKGA